MRIAFENLCTLTAGQNFINDNTNSNWSHTMNPCAVYWFHNKRDDSGIASVYVGKIGFNIITYNVFVQNVVYY